MYRQTRTAGKGIRSGSGQLPGDVAEDEGFRKIRDAGLYPSWAWPPDRGEEGAWDSCIRGGGT